MLSPGLMCGKMVEFQPVYHTVYTSPKRYTKTRHATTASITLHGQKNFSSQDFNHFQYLNYICITDIILTEIIIVFNCCGVTTTQLTAIVPLYSCNITLKMVAIPAETYR